MKKNKGFTLVELLATIAIMGMIMILVTPSIVNLQNNNKKQGSNSPPYTNEIRNIGMADRDAIYPMHKKQENDISEVYPEG